MKNKLFKEAQERRVSEAIIVALATILIAAGRFTKKILFFIKKNIKTIVLIIAVAIATFLWTYWFHPRILIETETVTKYVEVPAEDTSEEAPVEEQKTGAVRNYS